MPRPHTTEERSAIHRRLLDAGRDLFGRYGLHKTTVADLARDAGIGKGSFYHFFESKEELFLAVQEDEEERFKAALIADIESAGGGQAGIVTLLASVAQRLDSHPFLRSLLDPQTLQALALRIPAARLSQHRARDRSFFVELARDWKRRGWLATSIDPDLFVDVLSAMFALSVHRDLIGADTTERAIHEIAQAVAARWAGDSSGATAQ